MKYKGFIPKQEKEQLIKQGSIPVIDDDKNIIGKAYIDKNNDFIMEIHENIESKDQKNISIGFDEDG